MAGQIVPKGKGKWLVRVFLGRDANGKRRYTSKLVEGTKKKAEGELATMIHERNTGGLVSNPKGTLDEYLDTWLEHIRPSVRERTLNGYRDTLRRYVRPHLGGVKLSRLSPAVVRSWLVKLQGMKASRKLGGEERTLSPRTVRQAHECLRNALEQAVADNVIRVNPARSRLVKKSLPAKKRRTYTWISADRVADFLDVARHDRLAALWYVLLFGGLRPEEALALRWQDVVGDTLRIERVLIDTTGKFEDCKTDKSRRAVVVPQIVVDVLRDHRKRQLQERMAAGPEWRNTELIFTAETGQPLRQWKVWDAFNKVRVAAELPPMRVYDLRHSCASLLLEQGADLAVVAERLGHSTILLTGDTYAHISRRQQERAADMLGELANGAAE